MQRSPSLCPAESHLQCSVSLPQAWKKMSASPLLIRCWKLKIFSLYALERQDKVRLLTPTCCKSSKVVFAEWQLNYNQEYVASMQASERKAGKSCTFYLHTENFTSHAMSSNSGSVSQSKPANLHRVIQFSWAPSSCKPLRKLNNTTKERQL